LHENGVSRALSLAFTQLFKPDKPLILPDKGLAGKAFYLDKDMMRILPEDLKVASRP